MQLALMDLQAGGQGDAPGQPRRRGGGGGGEAAGGGGGGGGGEGEGLSPRRSCLRNAVLPGQASSLRLGR
jgi:hypothetical protein